MKAGKIDKLVYKTLYPHPRPNQDPTDFGDHLKRHLVPEVRTETQTFYGALNTDEARYPGLNYSYPPHRMRLSRFPWHRRLFRAFNELRLTESEIGSLCRWEGTKWAREKYEEDRGIKVYDTTGDSIEPWVEKEVRRGVTVHVHEPSAESRRTNMSDNTCTAVDQHMEDSPSPQAEQEIYDEDDDQEDEEDEGPTTTDENSSAASEHDDEDDMMLEPSALTHPGNGDGLEEDEDDDDDHDSAFNSVGLDLNARLLAADHERGQGLPAPVDDAWEQWLKEASEHGFNFDSETAERFTSSQGVTFVPVTVAALQAQGIAMSSVAAGAATVARMRNAPVAEPPVGGPERPRRPQPAEEMC